MMHSKCSWVFQTHGNSRYQLLHANFFIMDFLHIAYEWRFYNWSRRKWLHQKWQPIKCQHRKWQYLMRSNSKHSHRTLCHPTASFTATHIHHNHMRHTIMIHDTSSWSSYTGYNYPTNKVYVRYETGSFRKPKPELFQQYSIFSRLQRAIACNWDDVENVGLRYWHMFATRHWTTSGWWQRLLLLELATST